MFDISRKVNADCAVRVFTCYLETTLLGTSPISGDLVLSMKHRHEVVGVLFYFIFDAKFINNKAESDVAPLMHEQTRGVLGLMVS